MKPAWLKLLNLYRIFLILAVLEGGLAFWFLFRIPSESGNSLLLGFSLQRLVIGAVVLLFVGIFAALLFDTFRSHQLLRFLAAGMERILAIGVAHVILRTTLILIMSASLASLLFYLFPALQRLVFFLPNNYIFAVLGARAGVLLAWAFLISLQLLLLYILSGRRPAIDPPVPVKGMAICWLVLLFILAILAVWTLLSGKPSLAEFIGPGSKVLILSAWFTMWAFLDRDKKWAGRLFQPFVIASLFLSIFLVSLQFDQWFNYWGPRPDDQYILLADSFLHGKLYYIDVPFFKHDMNFFNGFWYQSKPPFPIILIMPFVAIWGVQAFNINTFSLILSSLTAVIIYLILGRLKELGWIKLNRAGAVWLTVLFEFGTVFWWLSIVGTAGPFSQVVTVLFCALAFLIVLKRGSPWLAGICLAAAVMSRPNVFVLWPALLFIAIQLNSEEGKRVDWGRIIKWGLSSTVPGILGAGLLLYYNFLRYGTFSDFGYGTLNGALDIVQNVNQYGLFSPHFILANLRVMFLAWPVLARQCAYFLPYGNGISILMCTPAILYLFRKLDFSWWISGCWISILLSVALLAMYSNNGANQYGYRYLMDFFVPVIMIIAYNAGEKVSVLLKSLTIVSIIINYYGTISTLNITC